MRREMLGKKEMGFGLGFGLLVLVTPTFIPNPILRPVI
jgi:hypothetical protein